MNEDHPPHKAQILRFARPSAARSGKRGRPRTARKDPDLGTPELILKRKLGQTTETLDYCLERHIITAEQHWCGIHLRWLYTLRHGAPGIKALNPAHLRNSAPIRADDVSWRQAREQEYLEAITALSQSGDIAIVVNISVYNERPSWLDNPAKLSAKQAAQNAAMRSRLHTGLNTLVKLWRKQKTTR